MAVSALPNIGIFLGIHGGCLVSLGEHRRRRVDLALCSTQVKKKLLNWVNAFANSCHENFNKLPAKEQKGASVKEEVVMKAPIKCKPGPVMLGVLNPRSGKGKASKVFRTKGLPILEVPALSTFLT